MSLSADAMTVAQSRTFQDRVRYHLTNAAKDVMAEAANTAGHALRVAYAGKVLDGTADYFSATVAVLTNPSIAASVAPGQADHGVPDDGLPYTVNTLFNALAGAAL